MRWTDLALAWRLLRRDWRAGELRVLAAALMLAVAAMASVGLFSDRVKLSLANQANDLLGADLLISGDRPLPEDFAVEARRRGMAVSQAVRFVSMTSAAGQNAAPVLTEVKAVDAAFPLRGKILLLDPTLPQGRAATGVPAGGEAWIDRRLARRLELEIGGRISIGAISLRVSAIVFQEPEASSGFLSVGPRMLINRSDLAATGLLAPGNRAVFRTMLAGSEVEPYRRWAEGVLQRGQKLETIRDLRPEVRQTLERAESFLGIASLVAVLLAAVAVALAAGRYLRRHLDASAMMRCMGAPQRQVLALYVAQFAWLGLVASLLGAFLGYAGQALLASLLGFVSAAGLPAPRLLPAVQSLGAGLLLLLGFALPPLFALARVPPLRVLRRDLGQVRAGGILAYGLGATVLAGLVLWQAQNLATGAWVLLVMVLLLASCLACARLLLSVVRRLPQKGYNWRYGLANLRRRPLGVSLQVSALALGIMALLLLTLVRGDLLRTWRATLPADAPNTFLINIQPEQLAPLQTFLEARQLVGGNLYPMVRGRLVEKNGRPVSPRDYTDERAQRLVDREFNLSWMAALPKGNEIVSGAWWSLPREGGRGEGSSQAAAGPSQGEPGMSLEQGIGESLGIKLGDQLVFDIAGQTVNTTVTSLRKVQWDSFRVNFFAIFPPGVLDDMPRSHITSFRAPADARGLANDLVQAFPNVLMIDVTEIMNQVQTVMDQVARAVQFVFLFTLVGGLLVLQAAIASTQDERQFDAAVLRTLGANRRQLAAAQLAEFAALGALAGVLAAGGATLLAWLLSDQVLKIPYRPDPWVWVIGISASVFGVGLAGWLGTRRILEMPPLLVLRETG
jgi:putative ABC transport system permease protein